MASTAANPDPVLVSLKAVDPAQYPYYGTVVLASGRPLRDVLQDNTAVVSEEFLLRDHSHVGDTLHVGQSNISRLPMYCARSQTEFLHRSVLDRA